MPQPFRYISLKRVAVLMGSVVGLYMLLGAGHCHAGEWSVDASTSKDVSTSSTVDGTTTDVSKAHSFSLGFDTLFAPLLEFSSEFTFDSSIELPDSDFKTTTDDTAFDLDLVAQWWSFEFAWVHQEVRPEDPSLPIEKSWAYGFQLEVDPEYEDLPDFTYTFISEEEAVTRTYEGAFEYTFLELVEITADATRETNDLRPGFEFDTDTRELSTSVTYTAEYSDTIEFDADWTMDRSQDLLLTSSGLLLEKVDVLDNSTQGTLDFTPLEWIETSISREISWSKDLMLPDEPTEREDSMSSEISLSPSLTETLELGLDHTDDRTKTSGSEAETRTWSQSIAATIDFTPMENLEFNASYDRSYDRTIPTAFGEVYEKNRDDAYDFDLEVSVYDEQVTYSVSRSIGYAWTQGVMTSNDSTWEHSLELTWEHIPNLEFGPTYTLTRDSNYFEGTQSTTRSIEADINYTIELGGVTTIELDHSYSRDAEYPDGEANYITRTDATSLALGLDNFLDGMSTEFSIDRDATDESGDDVGPVIDFTHSFTFDWDILEDYAFSFSYDHDMPQEGEDSENYSTEFSFSLYESRIEFSFTYDYSVQLEGDKNEETSYGIELSGEL